MHLAIHVALNVCCDLDRRTNEWANEWTDGPCVRDLCLDDPAVYALHGALGGPAVAPLPALLAGAVSRSQTFPARARQLAHWGVAKVALAPGTFTCPHVHVSLDHSLEFMLFVHRVPGTQLRRLNRGTHEVYSYRRTSVGERRL